MMILLKIVLFFRHAAFLSFIFYLAASLSALADEATPADTPVTIAMRSIEISSIDPVPAKDVLVLLGAATINVGQATIKHPLKLDIPLQGKDAKVGDKVYFFRKSTVMTADGNTQATWWLVENGLVASDVEGKFVASSTLRLNFSGDHLGIEVSGEYLVAKLRTGISLPSIQLNMNAGSWLTMDGLNITVGAIKTNQELVAALAERSAALTGGCLLYGAAKFVSVNKPTDENGRVVDLATTLPCTSSSPWGKVAYPNISQLTVDPVSHELIIAYSNKGSGIYEGKLEVRAVFDNGYHETVATLSGNVPSPIKIKHAQLVREDGKSYSYNSVRWELVRVLDRNHLTMTGTIITDDKPLEFEGDIVRMESRPQESWSTKFDLVNALRKMKILDNSLLDTIASSDVQLTTLCEGDEDRAFVVGKDVVYMVDMVGGELIETMNIKNVMSLACVASCMMLGEGNMEAIKDGHEEFHLLTMNVNPASRDYLKTVALDIGASDYGISSMTLTGDYQTLLVAVPGAGNTGKVMIYNLQTLDYSKALIDAPVVVKVPASTGHDKSGQVSPLVITVEHTEKFHLANTQGRIGTVTLKRNEEDDITDAELITADKNPL